MTPEQRRWTTLEGARLAEEVVARLLAGRSLSGLGLSEHDGRVDLRGLPVPTPQRLQRFEAAGWFVEQLGGLVTFRGRTLEGLDLSAGQLKSLRFHDCRLIDCNFAKANCHDWRMWACEIANCQFDQASLRDAAVGTYHNARKNCWRNVSFNHSDFRVGVNWAAAYFGCDFSFADLSKVQFQQCELAECTFAGELTEVLFDGRGVTKRPAPPPMRDVDFHDARFSFVRFLGDSLDGVRLPADPDIRLIRCARRVASTVLEMLANDDRPGALTVRAVLQSQLRGPGTDRDAWIFNSRDYLSLGGPPALALADELIRDVERQGD